MGKRFFFALLVCAMIVTMLAACSSGGSSDSSGGPGNAPVATAPAETENPRKTIKDSIPDGFSLNGKKISLFCEEGARKLDIGGEELTGDVISDAIFERNKTVESRLDFTLNTVVGTGDWKAFGEAFEAAVLGGDDAYQIIWTPSNASIQMGRDYCFMAINSVKHLDLDEPWWNKECMTGLSYDGNHIRYLVGDVVLSQFTWSGALVFNINLFEDNFGSAEELYKTVLERKLTYDKVREYASKAYKDVNGNGAADKGDIWGCLIDSKSTANAIGASARIRFLSRDEKGCYKLDTDMERAATFADMMVQFFHKTTGIDPSTINYDSNDTLTRFSSDQALFCFVPMRRTIEDTLRDMASDYGILPLPMMDEAQGEYATQAHNGAKAATIAVTNKNPDDTGAVLEALCSESYRNVTETFYDVAMKSKYSRDSYSGQVIDIIRTTTGREFVYYYTDIIGDIFRLPKVMETGENVFASNYASKKDAAQKALNDLVEKFSKIDSGK